MTARVGPDHDGLTFAPATPERWPDLEALLDRPGEPRRCWCMWWRLPRSAWPSTPPEARRAMLRRCVDAAPPPGVIASMGGAAVGWCSVAPRETHAALERSRVLARVDDAPVWSITCFVVARSHRRRGIMRRLLGAAVEHARSQGATAVEGYPGLHVEPVSLSGASGYMGLPEVFLDEGFVEVARRGRHLVMRRDLRP